MNIYYLKFKVVPTLNNEKFNDLQGAYAHCWIKELSDSAAYRKAVFYVKKYDWKVEEVEIYSSLVTRENFKGKEMGLDNYDKAQKEGMAFVYVSWARDGKSLFEPIILNSSLKFDLEKYLKQIKKNKKSGRCLHFNAGAECDQKLSNAHSIQKKQMLVKIQRDGQVYTLDSSFSNLTKNKGKLSYSRTGIGVFSIFRGLCKKHDNELFKSIDTQALIPTDQQAFLYAYRSLCKELYNKEIALKIYESQLKSGTNHSIVNESLKSMLLGTKFGLKNLCIHKIKFDESLKNGRFDDIRYVLFISDQPPNIAFSGGIFPDYDFLGRQLQDLSDHNSFLEMITFCSAPINSGWGILFAWHDSSSEVPVEYIKSLATVAYETHSFEDFLFRLAITSENHAIAPSWWEKLSAKHQEEIIEKTSETVNTFSETPRKYLMNGVEGISGWKFEKVMQNY